MSKQKHKRSLRKYMKIAINMYVCICVSVYANKYISFYTKMNIHFPANNFKIPAAHVIKN